MGIDYSSLREKDEIRLLRLEPGTGSAPLKCTLVHDRLGKSPTYDALSYMWGLDHVPGQPKTTTLQLGNNRAMKVHENLGNALRCLRLKDRVRVLWVDDICINQANDAERGHQVGQMGRIYSQATTVRIWLGLPDEFSLKAFQFLGNPGTVRRMKDGIVELEGWEAVATLCKRKYWGRLWVIQEVVLAARIDIHCGHMVLPWENFSNALFALEEGLQAIASVWTPFRAGAIIARVVDSAALKICRQRRAYRESGPFTELVSLLSLLWIHKDAQCMDVRDKVYGMHSFAPECCRQSVPVDYTCSAYTLCRRLLEHDIHFHFNERRNGGSDRLVRRSLDLHDLILRGALAQIQSKNSFELGRPGLGTELQRGIPTYQTPSPIMVLGNELGRVEFVTGPLRTLFVEGGSLVVPHAMIESFREMKFGIEEGETPALETRITRAFREIWRSSEMDILSSPGGEAEQNMEMSDLRCPELQRNPAIRGLKTFLIYCCEFLRTSDLLGAYPPYEDCLMYLARGGIYAGSSWKVGFAPVGTSIGDSVCTFKDTNIIAVVRNVGGERTMVGQGSTIASPQSKSAPQTGNVVNIQFDLSTLQMFSRSHQEFDPAEYGAALSMQLNSIDRSHGPLGDRRPAEVLIGPGSSGQMISSQSCHNETQPGRNEEARESPSCSPIASGCPQRKGKDPVKRYSCLKCRATFETSRDSLIHAATWSHQQCNKCQQWTYWPSSTSTTSTMPSCTQCRIEDPSYAGDPPQPHQAARISWAMSTSTDDSFRDSLMTLSDDLTSDDTTISDVTSICSDDTIMDVPERRRPHILPQEEPSPR